MSVSLIATSIGKWDEYAAPLIASVRKHEPDVDICIVDCGGSYPDEFMGARILKPGELNCSAAQNFGIKNTEADWYVISDIDVICGGTFVKEIEMFAMPNIVWGNKMHHPPAYGAEKPWLDGWIYAFHEEFFKEVGLFDTNFEGSGFEDADICWRGFDHGFGIALAPLPFIHKEAGVKRSISKGYDDVRRGNIKYLQEKHGLCQS